MLQVKYTFIEAWEGCEHCESRLDDSPAFRSLPSDLRLFVNALVGAKMPRPQPLDSSVTSGAIEDGGVADISCDAGLACGTPSSWRTFELLDAPGCPAAPPGPSDGDPDMAHQTPALSASMLGLPSAAPPMVSPSNVAFLSMGTEVEIDLLRPDFDGLVGAVQSWDPILRRYDVLLHGPAGALVVKTKRENLRLRPPPPPREAADTSTLAPRGTERTLLLAQGDVLAAQGGLCRLMLRRAKPNNARLQPCYWAALCWNMRGSTRG